MKNLNEFLSASSYAETNNNYKVTPLFEAYEIEQFESLQEVYEAIFDKMFDIEDDSINEGFFSALSNGLRKMADTTDKVKAKKDEFTKKLSDAAKNAIESAKEKAGKAWDKVKDTYTSVVGSIDNALKSTKDTIVKFAANAKLKVEEVESKIAAITTNAIAKGGNVGKKIGEIIADVAKAPFLVAFLTTAIAAASVGLDIKTLSGALTAALNN